MASRSDIEAGKAHVLVYVKNQVTAGLKAIGTSLKATGAQAIAVGTSVAAAGAAIVAPFVAAVSHFTEAGSALADMSARTGLSVAALGELKFAAEQTGAGLEDVEKSTARMQRTIAEAAEGNQTAVDSLKRIGLTAQDLAGKLPEEQLQIVADALAGISDPTIRTAAAMEILGKSGTKLLPMVSNLAELRRQARELGLVPTEEAVAMADAIGDSLDQVKSVFAATLFEIGAAIAPVLIPALDITVKIAAAVSKWIRENAQVVRTIAMIGAGLLAAGTIITVIGGGIFAIGTAFTAIAGAISTVGAILGTSLAAIFSPVGILVGVLGGLVFLWLKFSESGKSAIGQMMAALQPFINTIKGTFQGIFDALAGGDLALAGQIAITGLQLVLQQGLAALVSMFEGTFGDLVGTIGTELIQGDFVGAWETAALGITAVWDSLVAGVLETMKAMVDKIRDLWNGAVATIRVSVGIMRSGVNTVFGPGKIRDTLNAALTGADVVASTGGAVGNTALGVASAGAGIASAAANARERGSRDAFNRKIANGADNAAKAADDLGKRLDDLTRRAGAARARAAERFAAESPAAGVAGQVQTSVAGSFSASAFLALAQGGKTGIERIASDQLQEAKKQTEKIDEQIRSTKNLERLLTVA